MTDGALSKRILFVSGTLGGGGAERQLAELANRFAARGCEVTVVTWTGPDIADAYPLDPRVHRVHLALAEPASRPAVVGFLWRCVTGLRALFRRVRPDVVVSFITSMNVMTIVAGIGLGGRVVVSERMHPELDATVTRTWRVLRALTYRFADVVVAQTRDAAAWITTRVGARAVVIPNLLRELPEPPSAREPVVLAVGRLAHQKGFDLLLEAFARVVPQAPGWQLVILGEGPELEALQKLRDRLGLSSRVTFAGFVRDIEAWMGRAALVVQPSRFEGFPNAVLEAMGMGAAVISSDCKAGPSDLITDGIDGYLVPVDDIDALASRIGELMGSPVLRERLGTRAREVRERFSAARVLQQWIPALGIESTRHV
jgi:GalNAc-alpha-(1->4)-GalNAc-alpha-(1->3)-diNAcBac-PP-undecaprenol alpha-1,4-N-acetyl-D-galactosaminyltransferase